MWSHILKKCIYFSTDNHALVHIINKQSSKDKYLIYLVRELVLICLQSNILFQASHLGTKENILYDCLSRLKEQQFHQLALWMDKKTIVILRLPTLPPKNQSWGTCWRQHWHQISLKHINGHGLFIEMLNKNRNVAKKIIISMIVHCLRIRWVFFISCLFAEGYSNSSILSFISSIAYVHIINNLPENISCFLIQKTIKFLSENYTFNEYSCW